MDCDNIIVLENFKNFKKIIETHDCYLSSLAIRNGSFDQPGFHFLLTKPKFFTIQR